MYTCSVRPDCTIPADWAVDSDWTIPFNADPDAAGIGVIAAFYTAAWLTFVALTMTYLISDPSTFDDYGFCQLDIHFVGAVQKRTIYRKLMTNSMLSTKLPKSLKNTILILSDTHLVTGAAIAMVALIRHCNITQYHFTIAMHLVLVSSLAHSMTFSFVGEYLEKSVFFRTWRAIAMLILGALCFGMFTVTGNVYWGDIYGLPAQCGYDYLGAGFGLPATAYLGLLYWFLTRNYAFSLTVLIPALRSLKLISKGLSSSYWLARVSFFVGTSSLSLLEQVGAFDKRRKATHQSTAPILWEPEAPALWRAVCNNCIRCVASFLLVVHIFVYGIAQVWSSYAFNLLWMCYTLSISAETVAYLRFTAKDQGMQGDENQWGFGQLLAVLVFALPVLAMVETFFEWEGDATSNASEGSADDHVIDMTLIVDRDRDNDQEMWMRDGEAGDLGTAHSEVEIPCPRDSSVHIEMARNTENDMPSEHDARMSDKRARKSAQLKKVQRLQDDLWKSVVFKIWVLFAVGGFSVVIISTGV